MSDIKVLTSGGPPMWYHTTSLNAAGPFYMTPLNVTTIIKFQHELWRGQTFKPWPLK